MHLLFYPNIKKTETKSMLNRNLSLENFKTPGGHWEEQSHSLAGLVEDKGLSEYIGENGDNGLFEDYLKVRDVLVR